MSSDRVEPDPLDVIDRGGEADGSRDVRRARLELERHRVVRGLFERHAADHVAATLVRRHRVQQRELAVKHTDACRTVELVPGEGVEIAVERADVDLEVRRRLRAIHQHRRSDCMRELDDSANRVDRAERIGNVRDRNQSCSRIEERFELVHPQHPRVIDGCHAQPRPGLLAQELPRDDIRMVLHLRHEDLIACLEPAAAIALRDQVDRLCRAARKYDFLGVRRIDECSHLLPRRFERVRRALA